MGDIIARIAIGESIVELEADTLTGAVTHLHVVNASTTQACDIFVRGVMSRTQRVHPGTIRTSFLLSTLGALRDDLTLGVSVV